MGFSSRLKCNKISPVSCILALVTLNLKSGWLTVHQFSGGKLKCQELPLEAAMVLEASNWGYWLRPWPGWRGLLTKRANSASQVSHHLDWWTDLRLTLVQCQVTGTTWGADRKIVKNAGSWDFSGWPSLTHKMILGTLFIYTCLLVSKVSVFVVFEGHLHCAKDAKHLRGKRC